MTPTTGQVDRPRDVDASAVRRAALSSPHVAALHPGEHGEAATYLPGDRVVGVQVRNDSVVVHVVSRWGAAADDVIRDVRAAVRPAAGGRRIDIVLADVQLPTPDPAAVLTP